MTKPNRHCLDCHRLIDRAATVYGDDDAPPRPGDLTMCIYCGHLMGFDARGGLRPLTADEMHEVAGDPRVLAMQRARSKFKLQ